MLPVSHAKYAFLAVIAASATLSSSVLAQRPKNPPPDDCPNDNPECKCPTDDAVENGCVLISLDLGRTTPWTGSDSVKLKIRTTKASPSLSTPSQLKLVLGYSFMYVGSDLTAAGAPRFVFFAQSAGRTLSFQFADGSSVGVPSPGMYGESKTRLQMVDAEGWATLANPAYYDLYPGDGSVYRFSASPAAPDFGNLVHRIDPRGVLSTWEDMGVTVLRDASGNIRQVATRTRLADVQTLSDTHYTVTVYPLDAEPDTDPDTGLFVLPQWDPTRVLDVSQGSSPLELLVGFQKGTGDMRQYRYVEQNGEWTLMKPSGLVDSKEIFYSADETGARRLHLIRSPEGELLRRTEMNFASTPWGWAMTNRIEGIPGDATRTTSWSFYEEGPNRGEIREKITPTGNRILYEYDAQNRVVHESMPLVDEETLYSYEPVDPSDPTLLCDTRPRCIVKKMQGVEIQRTYYVYGTNGVDVIERVGEQGASYGGTNVLRTITTYYPATGAVTDGLVQSVRHEDGTIDNYAYDLTDGAWTETITHVHERSMLPIPLETKRLVTVYSRNNQPVESHIDLLIDDASWTPIEKWIQVYDLSGNEIRREDNRGRQEVFDWGRGCCGKTSETTWDGVSCVFAYDDDGNTILEHSDIKPDIDMYFEYDDIGTLVRTISSNRVNAARHVVVDYSYDSLGRLVNVSSNGALHARYEYSNNGLRVSRYDSDNHLRETTCLDFNLAIKERLVDNGMTEVRTTGVLQNGLSWESVFIEGLEESSLRTVTNNMLNQSVGIMIRKAGVKTFEQHFFDEFGRECRIEFQDGSSVLISFDDCGNLAREIFSFPEDSSFTKNYTRTYLITDQTIWLVNEERTCSSACPEFPMVRKRMSQLTNFERGEISHQKRIDKYGQSWEQIVRYMPQTKIVEVEEFDDSRINTKKYNYINRRLVKKINEMGHPLSFVYDGEGLLSEIVDIEGKRFHFEYDLNGNLIRRLSADNQVTIFDRDANSNITNVWFSDGRHIGYAYDDRRRKVSQFGDVPAVDLGYDSVGRLSSMLVHVDEDRVHTTRLSYQPETGRLTSRQYVEEDEELRFLRDDDGRIISRIDARGIVTTYQRDIQGRITHVAYSDETPSITFIYDSLGRLCSVFDATGETTFSYDQFGRRTNECSRGRGLFRSFDNWNRAKTLQTDNGYLHSLEYSPTNGSLSILKVGDINIVLKRNSSNEALSGIEYPNHSLSCLFDRGNNVTSMIYRLHSGGDLSRYDYVFNSRGQVSKRTLTRSDAAVRNDFFEYNERNELIRAELGTNSYCYAYDSIGSLTTKTINSHVVRYEAEQQHGEDVDDQSQDSLIRIFRDRAGNQTKVTTCTGDWNVYYDAENRPVTWSNETTVVTMCYDYLGRCFSEKVFESGELRNETSILYDGVFPIIIEQRSTGGLAKRYYIHWSSDMPQWARPIAIEEDDEIVFPEIDATCNVVSLISTNGTLERHFTYLPFGEPVDCDSENFPILAFSSERWNKVLGVSCFLYRIYNPDSGQWLSQDPSWIGVGINPYRYVSNSPIGHYDVLGLYGFDNASEDCFRLSENVTWEDFQQPLTPPRRANQVCQQKLEWLSRTELGGYFSQFEKADCQRPRMLCKCCKGNALGGYYDSDDNQIVICWNPDEQNQMGPTLKHEATHALQSCQAKKIGGCWHSIKKELEAYYVEGECSDFDSCMECAVASACYTENCEMMDFAGPEFQKINRWFIENFSSFGVFPRKEDYSNVLD